MTLLGVGTAVPELRLSQAEALARAPQMRQASPRQQRLLRRIYERCGVESRHCIAPDPDPNPSTAVRMRRYGPAALELGLRASREALAEAGVAAEAITHLVTVSCTGFAAPGFDLALVAGLPLAAGVARTHVGFMGCHGALNGLRLARAFVEADPHACVLLCSVELCSLHLQEGWNPDHIVANALFADGAAAVVAVAGQGPRGASSPGAGGLQLLASGSTVIPDTAGAMAWIIGNHGFSMALSARVPAVIQAQLRPWLDDWLAGLGLDLEAIRHWAVHPGGPRILTAVLESAELDDSRLAVSRGVLRQFGNMSSATLLFILQRLRQAPVPAAGPLPCLALGFGPGLCVEAALFRLEGATLAAPSTQPEALRGATDADEHP